MRVVIRTDAGGTYGLGHAKRMLGLARALEAAGAERIDVATKTRATTAVMAPLPVTCARPDAREEDLLLASRGAHTPDVLVVDLPWPYPSGLWALLRRQCRVVRVDAPEADGDSCHLLLIPNGHQAPEVVHRLSRVFEARLCYGMPYALLDPDIRRWRLHSWSQPVNRIVFVAGGSDPTGALGTLLAMTEALPEALPHVWFQYLVAEALHQPLAVAGLRPTQQVVGFHPRYLAGASLVVSLFGIMPYNLLHLGVPVLTVARTAADAEASRELMEATGATVDLGDLPSLRREPLCAAITELWADEVTRMRMAHLGPRLIDAKGAERCAEAILALGGA